MVITGLFVIVMGLRLVLAFTKPSPDPIEVLQRLPPVKVSPSQVAFDIPPPPRIPELKLEPLSAAGPAKPAEPRPPELA
jgi:hypothetical protein